MPPNAALSSALGWKCPQCSIRSLTTSTQRLAVGPEHPRYIEVPEPPQQTVADRPPVKGVLPVPRNIFSGVFNKKPDEQIIAQSTQTPKTQKTLAAGSREEWKAKMSEIRRRNLREGVRSLRTRQQTDLRRSQQRSLAKQREREELLNRPEREDERLTAPSNNLDLDALFNKPVSDHSREQRIERKKENLLLHQQTKRRERLENLHDLYVNAREFIVTPEQLDKAVEEAFGTTEKPVTFGARIDQFDTYADIHGRSIWAEGRPARVQDMLDKASGRKPRTAMEGVGTPTEINKERMRRIAETLTGGKMGPARK